MGSLAGLLSEMGHDVAGSDTAFFPPMGPALREWGVRCFEGFDPQLLDGKSHNGQRPEALIVGNVCRKDNPQVQHARELGIERMHIADALRRYVLPQTSSLVVAGTHGKTTTSTLCAELLTAAGLEPGYLVGGVPKAQGRSFRPAGKRRLFHSTAPKNARRTPFVLEGDEYDTAFWEKTAKFLHYDADVAIITSLEHDHIDIYPQFADYQLAFERFVRGLKPSGLLVAYAGDKHVVEASTHAPCPVAYYGVEGENHHGVAPHWLAAPAQTDETGTSFDLFAGGVFAGRFLCPLSGTHNLKNSVAALAACAQGYGAPLSALMRPLAAFQGVKRRQEVIGTPRGVTVYDDFAHHPSAVSETLQGLRARHKMGKLIAIFEPRSATACRGLHQHAYERAFDAASHVLLAPVGRSELPEDERLDVVMLAHDINERGAAWSVRSSPFGMGPVAWALHDVDSIILKALSLAEPGDTIAILSNGAFGGIHGKLLSALAPAAS